MLDENLPRSGGRGALLSELRREDLAPYGVDELDERIEKLEAEVERTRKALIAKRAKRDAADALFSFKS
jgi:uncharacterized small protein (DUF1192 family)